MNYGSDVIEQLSEHFSKHEFACRCGRKECPAVPVSKAFIQILERIRVEYDKPMFIVSGQRCPVYNTLVRGAVDSAHMRGLAADIKVYNAAGRYELTRLAYKYGITGIGVAENFIHLDVRGSTPSMWTYPNR